MKNEGEEGRVERKDLSMEKKDKDRRKMEAVSLTMI